jgi:hypothetical protein
MKTVGVVVIILVTGYFLPSLSQLTNFRLAKFWPVGLVRFPNDVCNSLEGYMGTCYTRRQCNDLGGLGSGSCANGIGQCCICAWFYVIVIHLFTIQISSGVLRWQLQLQQHLFH